jgi:hypothetical protein
VLEIDKPSPEGTVHIRHDAPQTLSQSATGRLDDVHARRLDHSVAHRGNSQWPRFGRPPLGDGHATPVDTQLLWATSGRENSVWVIYTSDRVWLFLSLFGGMTQSLIIDGFQP